MSIAGYYRWIVNRRRRSIYEGRRGFVWQSPVVLGFDYPFLRYHYTYIVSSQTFATEKKHFAKSHHKFDATFVQRHCP